MEDPLLSSREGSAQYERSALHVLDTRTLFVLLYAASLFVLAVRPTLDPDMWWHLRTGEYILQHGIPRQDIFSFTVSDHRWVTHEWLSQAIMWLLYSAGGFPALILSFAGVIAVAFWLLYRVSAGRPYLASFVGLLAAFASAPTWGARPQMFNIFFLALFVYLMERVRSGALTVRALGWFPVLTAVWANLHSGYLVGVVLLATYAAGNAVQVILRRWLPSHEREVSTRQSAALGVAAGASLFAAALNPNAFRLWLYPFETLRSPAMQQFIQEWHAPDFRLYFFWPFAALLLLGVVGWAYGKRPVATDVLLFLGTSAAGLLSARNIPLFAVVATPIVCRALWHLVGGAQNEEAAEHKRKGKHVGPSPLVNIGLLAVFILAGALWVAQTVAGNDEAIVEHYPVAAVDFLEAEGLGQARGYNAYGWGGYLIWRDIPVYVDGRADVYGDNFLFFYQRAAQLRQNWREPLERFSVDYVFIQRGSPLATMLSEVQGWQEVYADEMAQIFVRTP